MATFIVGSAGAALNTGLYVAYDGWWSLAGAIFCGALAIGGLVSEL